MNAEVPKPPPDSGRGEPAGLRWSLPGPAKVLGKARAVLDLFAAWGVEPKTLVEHPVLEGSDGVPVGFRVTRRKMGPGELRQAGLREQAWTGLGVLGGVPGIDHSPSRERAVPLTHEWVSAARTRRQTVLFLSPTPWVDPDSQSQEGRLMALALHRQGAEMTALGQYTHHQAVHMVTTLIPVAID